MCGPQITSARMTGGGLAMASPYGCRGNGIRAIHHALPERLRKKQAFGIDVMSGQDRRAGAVEAAHVRPADHQRPNDRWRARHGEPLRVSR